MTKDQGPPDHPTNISRSQLLTADCQIRRQTAGSGDPAGANCDALNIAIQVVPRFRTEVDEESLHRVAAEVLSQEGVAGETELSLVVTDDEGIRELNRRFRGVDAPTDVLAFGAGAEEHFVTAPENPPYLGDVVISYQRALAQAEELGHAGAEELRLLVIHGILHLLGYDHQEEADARKMREREERTLAKVQQ